MTLWAGKNRTNWYGWNVQILQPHKELISTWVDFCSSTVCHHCPGLSDGVLITFGLWIHRMVYVLGRHWYIQGAQFFRNFPVSIGTPVVVVKLQFYGSFNRNNEKKDSSNKNNWTLHHSSFFIKKTVLQKIEYCPVKDFLFSLGFGPIVSFMFLIGVQLMFVFFCVGNMYY